MAIDQQESPSSQSENKPDAEHGEQRKDMVLEAGTYSEQVYQTLSSNGHGPVFVVRKEPVTQQGNWPRRLFSPLAGFLIALVIMTAMLSFGIGSTLTSKPPASANTTANTTTTDSMNSSSTTSSTQATTTPNLPRATQNEGNQLAKYVIDPDGAKHFTLVAQQMLWQVVKGQWVPAYTINGTVPGPLIRVTAGDHIRVTFINHFHEATSVHWHGLEVPSSQDGVPGVGQKPIEPGQTYVYDFQVHDQDVGTHWYHSHYNDMTEMAGGFYGAFIVDPRPGSPQAQQAIHADVDYSAFIGTLPGGYYVINGHSFPDTQPIHVKHGQTVHMRLFGADTMMMHPMHLHGHTFTVVAEDGHALPQPSQRDTLQVAPGETYDLTFYAGAAPGSIYPFHCHILSHLMNPGQTGSEMGGLIVLIEYDK